MNSQLPLFTLLSVVILNVIGTFTFSQSKIEFRISPESTLALSGKSTVSEFSCDLRNNFGGEKKLMTSMISNELLKLEGADIEIIIENFDCANSRMERDLQDAMKAEQFPTMMLSIMEVNFKGGVDEILENKCTTALAEITLGNISQCILLNFNDIEFNNNLLVFSGSQEIDMREFQITPPQVFLGLVKVSELIIINFDLKVKLDF